jgi:hypothetical protein
MSHFLFAKGLKVGTKTLGASETGKGGFHRCYTTKINIPRVFASDPEFFGVSQWMSLLLGWVTDLQVAGRKANHVNASSIHGEEIQSLIRDHRSFVGLEPSLQGMKLYFPLQS